MILKEQLLMNHLAYQFIKNNQFELLHISEQNEEIWLEKYENRTSKVMRLTTRGFDWTNELKRDITNSINRIRSMGRLLIGKSVEFKSIYISEYAPVDDWQEVKKPLILKGSKQINIQVYYMNKENFVEEAERIANDISKFSLPALDREPALLQAELQKYRLFLNNLLIENRQKAGQLFSHAKPTITYLLIFFNIIFYMIIEFLGSSQDIPHLIQFGAKYNPLIMEHEWWRIFSSMFIHIGFIHLFMNMLALYYLGTAVERIYGPRKFLFIYTLGGVVGGLASFAFTVNVSAGASGAIFGLFGALLFFGLHERKIFLQTIGRGIIFVILFNIIFGFTVPNIDNGAHLGGLVAGFISSAIVHLPKRKDVGKQILAAIGYIIIVVALIVYGFNNDDNVIAHYIYKIDQELEQENYHHMIEIANDVIEMSQDENVHLQAYFQRSVAYIHLQQYDDAISDIEKTIEIDDTFAASYYNLALIYIEQNYIDKAKENASIAYDLDPFNEKYRDLYRKLFND